MEANLSLEWREDIIFAGLSEGTVRRYRMHMSDKETMPTKKELVYDEVSGSFLERGAEEEEGCERGDEYCIIDKESGNLVRLTIQEKERIFLDSLQVIIFL